MNRRWSAQFVGRVTISVSALSPRPSVIFVRNLKALLGGVVEEKRKGDSVKSWLTLSANVGVVIGLILLLIELDQNSDLVRAQIHQARSDAHVWMKEDSADSEFLLPALEKFRLAGGSKNMDAMDALTPIEAAHVKLSMEAAHQDYDNLFCQYQQGYLVEEYYQYRVAPTIKELAPCWQELDVFESGGRRPGFDAEIDRLMSDSQ